jgi:hypothetical protein
MVIREPAGNVLGAWAALTSIPRYYTPTAWLNGLKRAFLKMAIHPFRREVRGDGGFQTKTPTSKEHHEDLFND